MSKKQYYTFNILGRVTKIQRIDMMNSLRYIILFLEMYLYLN